MTHEDFEFSFHDSYYSVKSYHGNRQIVEIPAEYQGLPVTGIDIYAFSKCSPIELLRLSDAITEVDIWAFRHNSVRRMIIGKGIQRLDFLCDASFRVGLM